MSEIETPPPRGRLTPALIVAVVLAVLAALGVNVSLSGEGAPPAPVVTKVDATGNGVRDDPLVLTPKAQDHLQAVAEGDGELTEPLREPADPSRTEPGVLEGPLAAQEFPGCRTRFVGNYSSRNGVKPRIIVLHQTVSRERGQASQDALTAYANRRSSGVSWHFLIGPTNGLCTFSVPLNMKAWTQGNANPFAFGIEVERYGDEPTYVEGAGEAKLIAVMRELGRRFDIPMRAGKVVNCQVVRSGVVEHSDLGACGGGHADVKPWSTAPLIAKAAASPKVRKTYRAADYNLAALTAEERRQASTLLAERRVALRRGGWGKIDASHLRNANRAKQWLGERKAWLSARLSSEANRAERYRVIRAVVAV